MTTRRGFLGSALAIPAALSGTAATAVAATRLSAACAADWVAELDARAGSPEDIARDEEHWAQIGRAFTIDRSVTNLNNGGVSPSPAFVQEAVKRHLDYANNCPPPMALWQRQGPQRETVRARLARQWGVDAEEVAITRNASESLQICQLGIGLQPGDEVLTTTLDYPRMITTFKQRERRDGIVLKQFKIPIPCEDDDRLVALFEANVTPRTRVILMSHMVNITGQILPVKRVTAMARARGISVIVDGAHALAHLDFKLGDLECDYYGVSLHKWLFAPHGTGLLYVRRDKVKGLWPMMAADDKLTDDIRKFEEIGTHPAANFLAIGEALTFHQGIGGLRKEARLRYLRDTWATRLMKHDRVKLHTSLNPAFSCGIATVEIEGIEPDKIYGWLWDKHKILVTAIKHDEFSGIRVTPSVYTTMDDLDRFASAMEHVIKHGLPTV